MGFLADSRFNPAPGFLDFWNEFKKPNPWRWPILFVSTIPFGLIFLWLSDETVYAAPERPEITYITTYQPDRTDEEIIASNIANQEIQDLRDAQREAIEERKRELYKALGAATGMDVEEAERRGEAERAAAAAAEKARLDELMGRTGEDSEASDEPSGDTEGQTP